MAKKKVRLNACGKLRRHRPYTSYGKRIAALGTQAEIAEAMGLSQQTVSSKLRGRSETTLPDLEKIARHYSVPMTYFFEDGPCDPELYRVEEIIRSGPGPLSDLAESACSLSSRDHEALLAVAKGMALKSAGR